MIPLMPFGWLNKEIIIQFEQNKRLMIIVPIYYLALSSRRFSVNVDNHN